MDDQDFTKIAEQKIEEIFLLIEDKDDNNIVEADFLGDVLSIKTKLGEFVINKHSASKQIWLASPISGPSHFSYKKNKWLNSKNINLDELLTAEFEQL